MFVSLLYLGYLCFIGSGVDEQILWYENFDLENVFTPVDGNKFGDLLANAGYDPVKTQFIRQGFNTGFPLCYEGEQNVRKTSDNLKLRVGSKTELWNKIMKEVKERRVAGPFCKIPFNNFIQSPVGLVPKDQGRKTRLIFHLSHPKGKNTSINAGIPEELCSVQYPDFNQAVGMCFKWGKTCQIGKSDLSSAFRHAPLEKGLWKWLVMMAEHPETGEKFYFVDKCLPFGSSISCSHFQAISDALSFIVAHRSREENVNYLDDFLFAAICKYLCKRFRFSWTYVKK